MKIEKRFLICPNCNNEIEISDSDVEWGDVICPECKEFIELNKKEYVYKTVEQAYAPKDKNKAEKASSSDNKKSERANLSDSKPSLPLSKQRMFDIVLQIQSIRRMGIAAIIIAFINPIISLVLGLMGMERGNRLSDVPADLTDSLKDAIEYNKRAVIISLIIIAIYIILAIIGLIVYIVNN